MSISIYAIPKGWRADVCVGNHRKTKTGKIKSELTIWARKKELEFLKLNEQLQFVDAQNLQITLKDALTRYSQDESPKKRGYKKELIMINYLIRTLPSVEWPLASYQTKHIEDWQNKVMNNETRPLSAGSVLRYYSILGAFFTWCVKKHWIASSPMTHVEKPQQPHHRERRVTPDEIKIMLEALDYNLGTVPLLKKQEVGLIWLIAIATGMRSSEIVNMLRSNIHLEQRYLFIPTTKTSMHGRKVPLDKNAINLWQLALQIKTDSDRVFNVNDKSRDALWRKYRDKVGLKDMTFHDSRHEAASTMAFKLQDSMLLCKVFGWTNTKHALRYFNPTMDEISDILDAAINDDE